MFKFETNSFHYFSPKNSEYLNILDIQLREVGGKKTFKRYLKSEHTDEQTDGQIDGHFDIPFHTISESIVGSTLVSPII